MTRDWFCIGSMTAICIASLSLRLFLMPSSAVSASDEATYASVAATLVRDHFVPLPLTDFTVSNTGVYFFADKPPLLMYLIATSFALFGNSLAVARTVLILVNTSAIVAVFAIARDLYSRNTGIVAALVYAFFPVDVIIGSWLTPTPLDSSLICFALYFLTKYYLQGKQLRYLVLLTFVSFIADEWGLLVIVSLVLGSFALGQRSKFRSPSFLAGILVSVSPLIALLTLSHALLGGSGYVSNNVNGGSFVSFLPGDVATLASQLANPKVIPTLVGVFCVVGAAYCTLKRGPSDRLVIAIAISSLVVLVVGTSLSDGLYPSNGRYLIVLTPIISVLSAVGIQAIGHLLTKMSISTRDSRS